ncbi:NADH-dependent flavin oxidoreductase [Aspergillus bombycis]|uniref:NADH-dependent flavin oxidoreductase n=1 Tax=Aspergillus bombycis TaxID=109264 RepID=A0A1F8AFM1_9EURO|nr:NADH-dependent flavin oxidoreductase [Aspergillus bombycis]OGM50556.1 NADH-dependent flavin oxidoreductase [Aspergillus bombycis]
MASRELPDIVNKAAPGISYFTPAQEPPAGTAADPQSDGTAPPKLFQSLSVRGLTFHNRIGLSPLCQYSGDDGHMTDWHMAHLGGIAQRGPGFLMVEATAVEPEGRITPEDLGLWKDSQIEPLSRIIEFVHSQNQLIGVQIAHAGRKASTVAPWLSMNDTASKKVGGWPDNVKGPSDVPFNDRNPIPKEMTKQDIEDLKVAWVSAVKRAVKAGADFVEIHNAHGYLLMSFLSPAVNKRTDEYGGSFENRIRLSMEIAKLTREAVPEDKPVFLRVSATDWLEELRPPVPSWKVEDTAKFAQALAESGYIDLIDISSGGTHQAQHIHAKPGFQAPFAIAVKRAVGDKLKVGSVGMIDSAQLANSLLEKEGLDFVMVGRGFQKNPGLVWTWADDLNVEISMANQIRWGFSRRGAGPFLRKRQEKI